MTTRLRPAASERATGGVLVALRPRSGGFVAALALARLATLSPASHACPPAHGPSA